MQICSMRQSNKVYTYQLASFCALFFLLAVPMLVSADIVGERRRFFVDSSYDATGRESLDAILQVANTQVYFYIEEAWWNSQKPEDQPQIQSFFINLATEFEQKIYPTITGTFGSEWNPGIDGQAPISGLGHVKKDDRGGYTNYWDEY